VGRNGEIYVADFYGQRVQQLKPDGAFIRQWGMTGRTSHEVGGFYYPTDVALDRAGNVYMADGYGNRIQVFGPGGTFLRKWGGPLARGIYGPFNGWFTTVTSIVSDGQGNLFVADFYNHRVQKFTADGTYLTSFGDKGTGPGQFDHAIAVAVAGNGTVFVADFLNNRIQKWRPKR
jgi:DNA-binding beta-propeller fold protein YncE